MPRARGERGRASSYSGNGERHKSTILQLFGLTFIVMGQLHLLRSLIIIDRAAMRESFPPSGTCYAASSSSSFFNYRECRFFYSLPSFLLFLPPSSEASRFSQTPAGVSSSSASSDSGVIPAFTRRRILRRLSATVARNLISQYASVENSFVITPLALLAAIIPLVFCARQKYVRPSCRFREPAIRSRRRSRRNWREIPGSLKL